MGHFIERLTYLSRRREPFASGLGELLRREDRAPSFEPRNPSKKSGSLDWPTTARIWRRPFQSMPMAISTAWLATMPASRTRS
jgi:hypothetical protein